MKHLEMQRMEDEADKKLVKSLILQRASMMQYDDDFDEEDTFKGNRADIYAKTME